MLRRLKTIRERRRPCLEACLRFLLFGDENELGIPVDMRSESSSEEDECPATRKSRDFTVSLLRNNKNLAEPRTSQGVFGPNGKIFVFIPCNVYSRTTSRTEELICFFRALPRIVRPHQINGGSELASSPVTPSRPPHSSRLFQSPALLSDAVRRLGLAATDQRPETDSRRPGDSEHTLRIMTNLLTFSQQRAQWDISFETKDSNVTNDQGSNVSMIPTRRSTVFIRLSTDISLARRKVAAVYIFQASTLEDLCRFNASVAREHGQFAHERMFRTLQSLFPAHVATQNIFGIVARRIVNQMLVRSESLEGRSLLGYIGTGNCVRRVMCKCLPC